MALGGARGGGASMRVIGGPGSNRPDGRTGARGGPSRLQDAPHLGNAGPPHPGHVPEYQPPRGLPVGLATKPGDGLLRVIELAQSTPARGVIRLQPTPDRRRLVVAQPEELVVDTNAGGGVASLLADWLRADGAALFSPGRVRIEPMTAGRARVLVGDALSTTHVVAGSTLPAAADPTLSGEELTPRILATVPIAVTRAVLATVPNFEEWLAAGLRIALRRAMASSLFNGTDASGQPEGIFTSSDVETIAAPGAISALSAASFEGMVDAVEGAVPEDAPGGGLFAISDAVAKQARATTIGSGVASDRRVLRRLPRGDSEITDLGPAWRFGDLPARSAVYCADWSTVTVGVFGGGQDGVELLVDPFTANPDVVVSATMAYDLAITRPETVVRAQFGA